MNEGFMDTIVEIYKTQGFLHHAYLIEGGRDNVREALFAFLNGELAFPTRGNPDFSHFSFESFGVDDARELRDTQTRRALGGGRKVFVVETDAMTVEAQNALLKVLEEPTEGTHVFLVMPSASSLLPTLLSRVVRVKGVESAGDGQAATAFLSLTHAKRAEAIKAFIDDKAKPNPLDSDARPGRLRDKGGAVEFLNALETVLRGRIDLAKATEAELIALEEVGKAARYMRDRSSSVKQLLEHVSAILPVVK